MFLNAGNFVPNKAFSIKKEIINSTNNINEYLSQFFLFLIENCRIFISDITTSNNRYRTSYKLIKISQSSALQNKKYGRNIYKSSRDTFELPFQIISYRKIERIFYSKIYCIISLNSKICCVLNPKKRIKLFKKIFINFNFLRNLFLKFLKILKDNDI